MKKTLGFNAKNHPYPTKNTSFRLFFEVDSYK